VELGLLLLVPTLPLPREKWPGRLEAVRSVLSSTIVES
jgi:hypothetical protein